MTEYTQEEIDKIVAEKVALAQQRQYIADNGVMAFTLSLEYLGDQVKRNVIPKDVYDVMFQIYRTFRVDIGMDRPAELDASAKQKPTEE